MNVKELHNYLHGMSQKECRGLTARMKLVKPKRIKHTSRTFPSSNARSLRLNWNPAVLMQAIRRWICFCVVAVFHLGLDCAFFAVTSGCRKMINGGSGIQPPQNESLQARGLPRMRATSYLSSAALASQSRKAFSHCSVVGLPNISSITTTK